MMCAIDALGRDKVMFSADYPFEASEEAAEFMDHVAIDEDLRADVAYNNAAALLGLNNVAAQSPAGAVR
jgi:2,3-dihydroxybenzoate decarboxylase